MRDWADISSVTFIEEMYGRYLERPTSVPESWRQYFQSLASDHGGEPAVPPETGLCSLTGGGVRAPRRAEPAGLDQGDTHGQHLVDQLVRNYRVRGHMIADLDPVGPPRASPADLTPACLGLTDADMNRRFASDVFAGGGRYPLSQIIRRLRNTYCRHIGVQFMHIDDHALRRWLQERMESSENCVALTGRQQQRILRRLTEAVVFESFLQRHYIAAKTFSLQGAESLIPLLDMVIESAGDQEVREIVLAMSHRGRLNVLANIIGKPAQEIFREFEDADPSPHAGGDVKHHLGYSGDWKTAAGQKVHLSLCFNPSHLEFINPVALGRVRAKQDRFGDQQERSALGLLIHGDAGFAGEGVVQETLNLGELAGYGTGGTLHVIVNNQIGFTTPPEQGRSSLYCTDLAKMVQAPIFHVNSEAPEAVAQVIRLAMEFRKAFARDVFIDMYCYRLQGHNESDEPAFTQPMLYRAIRRRKSVRDGYLEHLLELGGVRKEAAYRIELEMTEQLDRALEEARRSGKAKTSASPAGVWADYRGGREEPADDRVTAVSKDRLIGLLDTTMRLPEGFHLHKKLEHGREARQQMARGGRPLDWATAELLALATLATEGHRVRLSGQDSQRGTFSQRHGVLHDTENGREYVPLQHLGDGQAEVEVLNSPLSEAGVLGFDYGYSLDCPEGLVIWEAQFGDFANAGQVIIDQFITSAEHKWRRLSGLVLLLPHGFEGQGPEHSSARIERFLLLATEHNIQLANPTTPAQYFHLLRRQVLRPWRKPLIVFTPKSLLRHPRAVSDLNDLAGGRFQRVIPDTDFDTPSSNTPKIDRLLLCSGKVYYDLAARKQKLGRQDVAIVRLEQLYPFPSESLQAALAPYTDDTPVIWVQEEPRNMGVWPYLGATSRHRLLDRFHLSAVTRPPSPSPATGSHSAHKMEQEDLVNRALTGQHDDQY